MDKKDIVIIILCVGLMVIGFYQFGPQAPPPDQAIYQEGEPLPAQVDDQPPPDLLPGTSPDGDRTGDTQAPGAAAPAVAIGEFAALAAARPMTLTGGDSATYVIDPEAGGLVRAEMKGLDMTLGHPELPIAAIGPDGSTWRFSHAKVIEHDARTVTIVRQVLDRPLVIEQTWSVGSLTPYDLHYQVVFRNVGDIEQVLPPLSMRAGTMQDLGTPKGFMGAGGIDQRVDLRISGKESPKTYPVAKVRKLDGEDRLELQNQPVDWMAVQNKYFASIVSGETPLPGSRMETVPRLALALVQPEAGPPRCVGILKRLDKGPALAVTLASSAPDAVTVPAEVVLPARATATTFAVTVADDAAAARITASAKGLAGSEASYPPPRANGHEAVNPDDILAGYLRLPTITVPPGDSQALTFDFYVGPKRFDLLRKLGENKESLMQFDLLLFMHFNWFEHISRLILWALITFHQIFGSYGLAILLITFILRLVFWPVTHRSTVMSKKMQAIAPLAKELRAKYANDPTKLHQKTMELYKENKINPLSGCLPALLQIPAFFALFNVLRSAIELRHASFLWATDLSLPDTVAILPLIGLPLNPLAIIMGATMVLQMKVVPTSADPAQQRMMMIMSASFIIFLYTMPSGLTLYWAANQILNIIQYRITHKLMDKNGTVATANA